MRFLLSLAILFGLSSLTFGQSPNKTTNPKEVQIEVNNARGLPKELEGLSWNRWTSKNFVVCSINDQQAQYLHKHLELVKGWIYSRWGMYDIDFSVPCKLICVDSKDLYKKLFNLERTKVEIRRDKDGKISETIIFMLIDGPPSKIVPIPLTEVCLAEFGQKYDAKFGVWTYKGMAALNGTLDQVRERLVEIKPILDKNEPFFFSKGLMTIDPEQYRLLPFDKRRIYDNSSMALCLMIRQEFGQDLYLSFMKASAESNPEEALKSVLKFDSYDHFDRTFKRYMMDLSGDVVSKKTPDSYLQIKEASR